MSLPPLGTFSALFRETQIVSLNFSMTNMTMQDVAIQEQNMWTPMRRIQESLFDMVNQLLRTSPAVRTLVVEWIGYALQVIDSATQHDGME